MGQRRSKLDRHGAELLALRRAGATVAQLTRWLRFERNTVVAATTVGRWLDNVRRIRGVHGTGDFDAAAALDALRARDRELRSPHLAASCIDEYGYHVAAEVPFPGGGTGIAAHGRVRARTRDLPAPGRCRGVPACSGGPVPYQCWAERVLQQAFGRRVGRGSGGGWLPRSAAQPEQRSRAFKHHGLSVPDRGDAATFAVNVRDFLADVTREAFDIDFASVSLVDAIGHHRTRNWIRNAEDALAEGVHEEAMRCVAGAFEIYLRHRRRRDGGLGWLGRSGVGGLRASHFFGALGSEMEYLATAVMEWVDTRLATVEDRLDLSTHGVDLADYDRFKVFTPGVSFALNGSMHFGMGHGAETSSEDVRFCIDFAVEAALALGGRQQDAGSAPVGPAARVIRECSVVVMPRAEDAEVIRKATTGEVLGVAENTGFHGAGFVAVDQDGDVAYVPAECVELEREDTPPAAG